MYKFGVSERSAPLVFVYQLAVSIVRGRRDRMTSEQKEEVFRWSERQKAIYVEAPVWHSDVFVAGYELFDRTAISKIATGVIGCYGIELRGRTCKTRLPVGGHLRRPLFNVKRSFYAAHFTPKSNIVHVIPSRRRGDNGGRVGLQWRPLHENATFSVRSLVRRAGVRLRYCQPPSRTVYPLLFEDRACTRARLDYERCEINSLVAKHQSSKAFG